MAIVSFTFDAGLAEKFVELPYTIYRGDPKWIPPQRSQLRSRLSPSFSFYRKKGNVHRHFLAMVDGSARGRISATLNQALRDTDGSAVGCVGMFDCYDDRLIARDLLQAATGWLLEECGVRRIWGPMDFDIWHGYRCMTRGFEHKPFIGEPYNKPYVPGFFEENGFVPKGIWDSIEVSTRDVLERQRDRGERRLRDLLARGYRIEHFNVREFDGQMEVLYEAVRDSFSSFVGYTPITLDEFREIFTPVRHAIDPRFIVFLYNEAGRLAGFAGAFLEISDALRSMEGRQGMLGTMQFLYQRRHVDRILFYFGGQVAEERRRQSGSGRGLFHYLVKQIVEAGYENMIVALRSSENKSRAFVAGNNETGLREYTLYQLERAHES